MPDTELTEFGCGDTGSEASSEESLPESVPESLTEEWIPPVSNREEIAPAHPVCDVRVGDLLTIHIGDEDLEVFGFLILDIYASELIGIHLHNQNYGTRDRDKWVEWYEEYGEEGRFESGDIRIYREIAPCNPNGTTRNQ
jgi:hypothetical protein